MTTVLFSFIFMSGIQFSTPGMFIQSAVNYNWIDTSDGRIVSSHVKGGDEAGKILYVCRFKSGTEMVAGYVKGKFCVAVKGAKSISSSKYQGLSSSGNYRWVNVQKSTIPPGTISYSTTRGSDICRIDTGNARYPGVVNGLYCIASISGKFRKENLSSVLVGGRRPQWVNSTGTIPVDAVKSINRTGKLSHICRARVDGTWTSGFVEGTFCNVALLGSGKKIRQFQIITYDGTTSWIASSTGKDVPYSVLNGNGRICRSNDTTRTPGNLTGIHCSIYRAGNEHKYSSYEVLLIP